MELLRDPEALSALIERNCPPELIRSDFDAREWLSDPANFALVEGNDLSMWEAGEWPGPLTVHVMFASRGKRALEAAREMLGIAFGYGATAVRAGIPSGRHDVLMFARLLGFSQTGSEERWFGPATLVELSPSVKY
jgi:hypothetical protein